MKHICLKTGTRILSGILSMSMMAGILSMPVMANETDTYKPVNDLKFTSNIKMNTEVESEEDGSTATDNTVQGSEPASNENVSSSQNTEDQSSSDTTAAVANGEVWKCTQKLNTPTGYNGGLIRLELVQNVGGAPKASSVVEGQQLTFPYQLDITGAPGVAEGTLYLSEQQSDGSYQELGHYPLTFEKVE